MAFLAQCVRELLAQGGFQGRRAVIALPAASMFFQHLRLPKMDEAALKKTLPWEARGKLPIDPTHALLRHHIAGEVFQEQETRTEVILMAASRDLVHNYLATASRAKLDVIGMNVEPKAIVDCFAHIYRRKSDVEVTNCFIDIGFTSTRAVIARGSHILFARSIPLGGDHLSRAVSTQLQINLEQARLLRWQLAGVAAWANDNAKRQEETPADPPAQSADTGFAVLDAALAAARRGGDSTATATAPEQTTVQIPQSQQIEGAMLDPLKKMVEELDLCRRYYEATFPNRPVERLVFVGGEARNRWVCHHIAQELGIAAQVGDPLARMSRVNDIGPDSGIDRRLAQPNWVVAIGLSLGPVGGAALRTQSQAA
jgi:type IV pilus assembly protein PilM